MPKKKYIDIYWGLIKNDFKLGITQYKGVQYSNKEESSQEKMCMSIYYHIFQ